MPFTIHAFTCTQPSVAVRLGGWDKVGSFVFGKSAQQGWQLGELQAWGTRLPERGPSMQWESHLPAEHPDTSTNTDKARASALNLGPQAD